MKLNNKGYAITIIVFGILIVFIIVLSSLLVTMNNSVKLNKVVKEDVIENIQLGADTTGMSLTERIEQLEVNYNELLKTSTENYNKLSNQIITTKQDTIDEIYPVGSIYISTTDDSIDDVVARFGGQWEKYSQGRTLVGEGTGTDINGNVSTFVVNNTGGEYSHTLTIDEMPSHNHNYNKSDIITGSTVLTIDQIPSHIHNGITWFSNFPISLNTGGVTGLELQVKNGLADAGVNGIKTNATGGGQGHTHSISQTTIASSNTGSGSSFSVQNPYITVYMYKRIK